VKDTIMLIVALALAGIAMIYVATLMPTDCKVTLLTPCDGARR
jgi:hypothetical protein